MSRRTHSLLLAALSLASVAVVAIPMAPAVAVDAGTTVSLPFGKDVDFTAAGREWRLRLADVHDSRCPARVECIWAGVAGVTIHVVRLPDGADAPQDIGLALPGNPQTLLGAVFTLDGLDPRPSVGGTSAAYVASVRITPAETK